MNTRMLIGLAVLGVLAGTVFGRIDSEVEGYYGLDRIGEPYVGRIRQLIGLNAINYKAIRASGFSVYVLDQTVKQEFQKFHVWRDTEGGKWVTKHFIGTKEMFMKEGDAYVGSLSPLWLSVYKDGEEVKFTIPR